MCADLVLQVFAKPPKLGCVKTRLGREIGAAAALHWYRILLHRTLKTAATMPAQLQVWCPPGECTFELEQMLEGAPVSFHQQCAGDLGVRMACALQAGLNSGPRVLLIGADCPVWTLSDLSAADAALSQASMVVVPAEDGGYVGIGVTERVPPVFDGVAWSSAQVMAQTRQLVSKAGVDCFELPTLWDVDRLADLERWIAAEPNLPRPIVA